MVRGLLLRTITTLLFASPFLSVPWAQDQAQQSPYLSGAEITSQLSYSCPSNTACSFICPIWEQCLSATITMLQLCFMIFQREKDHTPAGLA